MINAGVLLAPSRNLIFGAPVNTLGLTASFSCEKQGSYEHPLISGGLCLCLRCSARVRHCLVMLLLVVVVYESVDMTDLLSDDFDSKQSRESVDLLGLSPLPSGRVRLFGFQSVSQRFGMYLEVLASFP